MSEWTLYHNPQCSTSRKVLDRLTELGLKPRVVQYLKDPPTVAALLDLMSKLNSEPHSLARRKEDYWKRHDPANLSRKELAQKISADPILLERPIAVRGAKAVVARPPERLDDLL